jgi:5-methylcytosine-specific restriction endonuclease McrA
MSKKSRRSEQNRIARMRENSRLSAMSCNEIGAEHKSRAIQSQQNKSGPVTFIDPKTFKPKQITARSIKQKTIRKVTSDEFLKSYEWRKLRMVALKKHGARCQCCGATTANGVMMNVDHIKPRKTHPHLALNLDNLQILCEVCNHGKGNWDTTDWRAPAANDDDDDVFLAALGRVGK